MKLYLLTLNITGGKIFKKSILCHMHGTHMEQMPLGTAILQKTNEKRIHKAQIGQKISAHLVILLFSGARRLKGNGNII